MIGERAVSRVSSVNLARLAGRALETGKATPAEVRSLAASVLSQTEVRINARDLARLLDARIKCALGGSSRRPTKMV